MSKATRNWIIGGVIVAAAAVGVVMLQPSEQTDVWAAQTSVRVAGFTSTIPIIVLRAEQNGSVSSSKTYSAFSMDVFEPKPGGVARLSDAPTMTTRTGVRLRGMVSRFFPKLSYRLQLQDAQGASHGQPLLGMPADADWALQGPYLDKSLIRNAFSYDLARAMGASGMRTRACEVFLIAGKRAIRDTDYIGVYQFTEDVERGDDRVKLAALAPTDNAEPAISGGYLLAWDVGDGRYLPSWNSIQIKYPKTPTRAQIAYIDNAFTQFDRALKGPDARDPVKGYAAHIEPDDWVNYILFEELVFNLDGYSRSFYLMKERGRKIRPGPVWDHDLAMGHEFPPSTSFDQWWYIGRRPEHGWMSRLASDPAFFKKMMTRWAALRKTVLRDEAIDARIDTYAGPLLKGPGDRNFDRWKILNIEAPFRTREYKTFATDTYPEQIAALKKFLRDRAAWMDSHLR